MTKTGRNDPCPCGSGQKYKKCCLNKALTNEHYEVRRTQHWHLEEIEPFSTPEIIAKLRYFGVPFNRDDFLRDVLQYDAACDLADSWMENHRITAQGFDMDFIWLACIILWKRLAPDIINSEQLDDLMQDGYKDLAKNKDGEACDKWLHVWHHLQQRFTAEMKTISDAERVFSGLQSVANWSQDLEMALWNAGLEDHKYHHERIKFGEAFCRYFPESSELTMVNTLRAVAESCYQIGEIEKGEGIFKNLINAYPDNVWGYIGWGDMYTLGTKNGGVEIDPKRAREIYERAQDKAMDDKDVLLERLADLDASFPTSSSNEVTPPVRGGSS